MLGFQALISEDKVVPWLRLTQNLTRSFHLSWLLWAEILDSFVFHQKKPKLHWKTSTPHLRLSYARKSNRNCLLWNKSASDQRRLRASARRWKRMHLSSKVALVWMTPKKTIWVTLTPQLRAYDSSTKTNNLSHRIKRRKIKFWKRRFSKRLLLSKSNRN